ncbi:MAG: tRNA pseudouridine(55) synthase TruB [Tepidiformaceae bacterium]
MSALHGILLIDKQPGWTSHDVVAKTRGLTGQRKIGHTGTLDPMATGLLVLCLGDATRFVEYMTGHDKRYEGEVTLGTSTDTDDAEGSITGGGVIPELTEAALRQLEVQFSGELLQRPPAYSAVKVAGQRAYAVARSGKKLELAERPVVVYSLRLKRGGPERLVMSVHCGSGTYVRSLARDIGAALECGGHLSALRRVSAGRFNVADAATLDAVAEACAGSGLDELLLPADEGIADTDVAIVTLPHGEEFRHGSVVRCSAGELPAPGPVRIYDTAGSFLGVGRRTGGGELRALKVLAGS